MNTENRLILKDEVFITSNKCEINEYHIHIDSPIEDMDYFRPMYGVLSSASEEDTVVIHLNSPGGNLETALNVYHWLSLTPANTVVLLEGVCASAASLFVMVADNVVVMPHSGLMLHSASYGYYESQKRVKSFVDFQDKWLYGLFEDIYEGFLTEEEIHRLIDSSEELWLVDTEVEERLQQRNKYLEGKNNPVAEETPKKVKKKATKTKKKEE